MAWCNQISVESAAKSQPTTAFVSIDNVFVLLPPIPWANETLCFFTRLSVCMFFSVCVCTCVCAYENLSLINLPSTCSFYFCDGSVLPSVHWCCWLGGRKGIWPVKHWVVGCWRSYLSGARCRLVVCVARLMPLSLTVSCYSKIQDWFYLSGTGSSG